MISFYSFIFHLLFFFFLFSILSFLILSNFSSWVCVCRVCACVCVCGCVIGRLFTMQTKNPEPQPKGMFEDVYFNDDINVLITVAIQMS